MLIDLTQTGFGGGGFVPVAVSETQLLARLTAAEQAMGADARHDAAWQHAVQLARQDSDVNKTIGDLTARAREVLGEIRPPLKMAPNIDIVSDVSVGADKFRMERRTSRGRPQQYKGGSSFARVSTGIDHEDYPIFTYAVAVEGDIFRAAANAMAGRGDQMAQDLRSAMERYDELLDEISAVGDSVDLGKGIAAPLGLFNAKYVPRNYSAVSFDGTNTAQEELDELIRIYDAVSEGSNDAFKTTHMGMSLQVFNHISKRRLSTTSSDTTVLEAFQRSRAGVVIYTTQRFRNPDGDGLDAIAAYEKRASVVQHKLVQAPTILAPFRHTAIGTQTVAIMRTGGVVAAAPAGMYVSMVTPNT